MKDTITTCAHLLATAQWRLVDAVRWSAARGTGGGVRCEAQMAQGTGGVRGTRRTRREAGLVRPCEAKGAGAHDIRRESIGCARCGTHAARGGPCDRARRDTKV